MRKSILLLSIVAFISTVSINAQKLKIGHVNSQELLAAMPESDSAQKEIEKIAKDHELALEEMSVEFNKKLDDYSRNAATYSDLKKATKESELQDLQKRIESFRQTAEQDLAQKRMEIYQPVQEKAIDAINEVAEENGFTYILDAGMGAVIYSSPDSEDILPLVKKKLGIE